MGSKITGKIPTAEKYEYTDPITFERVMGSKYTITWVDKKSGETKSKTIRYRNTKPEALQDKLDKANLKKGSSVSQVPGIKWDKTSKQIVADDQPETSFRK